MPEYLAPGVYIEEISTGPVPIEGVSTSTSGFVGQTARGPTSPVLVTSWLSYQRWFGVHTDPAVSFLSYAIQGFFENGGRRAFVSRVTRSDATPANLALATDGAVTLVVQALGAGEWGNRIFLRVRDGSRSGFRLTILYFSEAPLNFVDPTDSANLNNPDRREPDVIEDYDNLSFDPRGPNYVLTRVNGASHLVNVQWSDPAVPTARPANIAFDGGQLLGGSDGSVAMNADRYIGNGAGDPSISSRSRTGLASLEMIDEISLLCVPDEVHPALNPVAQGAIASAVINQCERLRDRFAILQTPQGQGDVTLVSTSLPSQQDSQYAAVFYPWVHVFDARSQDALLVPPGGHVTGVYARTDIERGVHKAPANEELRGIITRDLSGDRGPLEYRLTKEQHDILNPLGINVLRDFRPDGRGIRVWGARTRSSDPQWRYVNVRRLFIFIEESIEEGTQWAVFEPNDEPLWSRVRRSITNFLIGVWRSGALMGTTQEQAFFVKCDRTTMTQDDIDNGRLVCYIGLAPVKPAEYVIFRFSQKTADVTT
ncbi:MAG TPA: phage tail sheath C-terminal domain-containing protein [Abditibacteriaceae bacterium]|jgi:hypothetical protein